jgi:hypothetical protein
VEEFITYGVWPLAHGWVLSEVTPHRMPTMGGQMVRSPLFAMDLRGRNATTFVREVETMKIVGKYVSKMGTLRSWDIRGSNVRLNRVFELNHLSYGGYLEGDCANVASRRGKQTMSLAEEGPLRDKAPGAATRKRKLGTAAEDLGLCASDHFVVDLLETCAAPGEMMSSPELQESSTRMLKVTRGRWPRNVLIPGWMVKTYLCLD